MSKFILVGLLLVIFPLSVYANTSNEVLDNINQKVCNRFEEDTAKLAGIMEELRRRKGIEETRVAFGGIDDAIKSADYQITFAAEAIAYQRAQKVSSSSQLKGSLQTLRSKVLKAKTEVTKALNE